ncbi:beta-galactosidase [Pelagicoccus enzymogenes]|uniref:beta-galactosidase n=1 Tax=Pelagicoccus enzymogenes TaxID=2773457 RepID=UPI00280D3693|nr:beta-galactosidase [Pelagicoccus enzymogenes]MDQ8201186.1 beta-galactosidase [Pelagicoccus enzymogenes]
MRWNRLEPTRGRYEFDRWLGEPMKAAVEDDLYVTLMIWVRPGTPEWLFDEEGVPRVYTDRDVDPLGRKMDKENNLHPYYLHPAYKKSFGELIDALGKYVSELPMGLRERILWVQSAEGSTGDGSPYKGNPLDSRFAISEANWSAFRRETWIRYQSALPGIPIVVNSDANSEEEYEWLLENMEVLGLKHGMFSHGYHVSGNVERLRVFDKVAAEAERRGIEVLTRGEQDGEMFVYGWSTKNIPQALYWSGIFATHCRLDVWNVPHKALKDPANFPAFAFFNRYAGLKDPEASPRAFCALRDGLDASDFQRFPASEFGGVEGRKRDVDRYLKIAAAYAPYGARMEDPEKALGGGMVNRKRNGYNDVGWGILPGNYSRFLTQVEPGSGDVGLWNVDDSIYGRFARAFERKSGKTQMRFRLDERFDADQILVSVTYWDRGRGRWSIEVPDGTDRLRVSNSDSSTWKTVSVQMPRGDLRHAELRLKYEGGDDTVFNMVEIEKVE